MSCFSGEYLIVGDAKAGGGSVRIYEDGKLLYIKELEQCVYTVDCDDEGEIFVAASYNGRLLFLQRNDNGFMENIVELHKNVGEKGLSLGNKGAVLLVGTTEGYFYMFKINVSKVNGLKIEKTIELKLSDNKIRVGAARYSNLGVAASELGDIFLIDTSLGNMITKIHINDRIMYRALSISPDGNYVTLGTAKGRVMLFNSKLRLLWDYDISKNFTSDINSAIMEVAISLEGINVAAASANGYAYIFDGNNGTLLFAFRNNLASKSGGLLGAWNIDISQDAQHAIVGGAEGFGDAYVLAKFRDKWEAAKYILTWEAVRVVKISSNGKYVAVGTVDPYATYGERARIFGWASIHVCKTPTLIILDITPPEIGDPVQNPTNNIQPTTRVTITVNVTDRESGVSQVILQYTKDNGITWQNLYMQLNTTTNLYTAEMPRQQTGTIVQYKIIAYDNAGNSALKDGNGSYGYIVVPGVRVLAPNGSESLTAGSTFRIRWEASDNVGVSYVIIWLFQGSSQIDVIADRHANTGYYDWTVPNRPGTNYRIRIATVDAAGNAGYDDSDMAFSIQTMPSPTPTPTPTAAPAGLTTEQKVRPG
ncbi:MAG: Ser-Thr-rich GPI-anchored membrane family protein [Candidatus Bathyarchaeia archaeon]